LKYHREAGFGLGKRARGAGRQHRIGSFTAKKKITHEKQKKKKIVLRFAPPEQNGEPFLRRRAGAGKWPGVFSQPIRAAVTQLASKKTRSKKKKARPKKKASGNRFDGFGDRGYRVPPVFMRGPGVFPVEQIGGCGHGEVVSVDWLDVGRKAESSRHSY